MPSSRKASSSTIRIHFAKPVPPPLRKATRTSCSTSQRSVPGAGRATSGICIGGVGGEVEEHVLQRQLVRAGAGAKLGEGAPHQNTAAMDDADAVGEPLGDFEDMGGDDDGGAAADLLL